MVRILVVDDEENLLKTLSLILKKHDFLVNTATNGFQVLRLFQDGKKYDLLITDVNLPVMDGFSLAKEVRKLCPEIRIIGMSGETFKNKDIEIFDYFLIKPFDMEELIFSIHHLLRVINSL